MGTFRNEAIRRLFIGLGIVVALYFGFVMMPMAKVPLYTAGVLGPSVPGVNRDLGSVKGRRTAKAACA